MSWIVPVLAAGLVGSGVGLGAAPEPVTLLAQPTVLGRDQALRLFGSVGSDSAEEIVTIEARDCGQSAFRSVAAVRTRAGGGWSTQVVHPGISAAFRAAWNGHASAPVTVRARAFVILRRRGGSSRTFTVGVGAKLQFWHRYVVVERFERRLGTWKPVRKVVLTETASAPGQSSVLSYEDVTISVPSGTLIRASLPRSQAGACYLPGYSQQLRT